MAFDYIDVYKTKDSLKVTDGALELVKNRRVYAANIKGAAQSKDEYAEENTNGYATQNKFSILSTD